MRKTLIISGEVSEYEKMNVVVLLSKFEKINLAYQVYCVIKSNKKTQIVEHEGIQFHFFKRKNDEQTPQETPEPKRRQSSKTK